ncbi:metallophosphoesterase [Massilia niastensis]|uniref:metallophosphoesterase n=1 Tax=Massilia niastensis TaxID=544911 RepID=UPI00035CD156|nr:metallophosphoesterase [Massilia niastensis]
MFSIVLNICGSLMHFYVAHRLYSLPLLRERMSPRPWWAGALVLWLVYLAGVHLGDQALDWRWWPGQFALTWLGVLFMMSMCLLAADVLTGFGFWWRRHARRLLGGGVAAGLLLSGYALYQGMRAPVVVEHEVALAGLPRALDGTVLVAVSDLHLGAQRRAAWMAARVRQINALQPAAVVMLGDQVEDEPLGEPALAAALRGLRAPAGVWAVTGNHEYYGDAAATIAEFEQGGVRWLRDQRVELLPGLVLAGVDDIGRAMRGGRGLVGGLERTIPAPAASATILLSHIPAGPMVDRAETLGVDLMLSGHTHGGQIWPFDYLVRQRFPAVAGAHQVGAMTLLVTRGAGSWGPRMRLWQPGEIVKLTLRSGR